MRSPQLLKIIKVVGLIQAAIASFQFFYIDYRATEKWKQGGLSKTEIYLSLQITQENMQRHNYTIEPIKANPIRIVLAWLFLPIKLTLAVLFNLQRLKNIVAEINKRI